MKGAGMGTAATAIAYLNKSSLNTYSCSVPVGGPGSAVLVKMTRTWLHHGGISIYQGQDRLMMINHNPGSEMFH